MPGQGSANGSGSFSRGPGGKKAVDSESSGLAETALLFVDVKLLWQRFTGVVPLLECSSGTDAHLEMYRFFNGVIMLNNCRSGAHVDKYGPS